MCALFLVVVTGRPRLGTRLYVRGNTRRILRALLEELCNWISRTRLQSARLLRTIIIFCEVSGAGGPRLLFDVA